MFRITFICVEMREIVEQVVRRNAACHLDGESMHNRSPGAPSSVFALSLIRGGTCVRPLVKFG